jgi:hypothetical protein
MRGDLCGILLVLCVPSLSVRCQANTGATHREPAGENCIIFCTRCQENTRIFLMLYTFLQPDKLPRIARIRQIFADQRNSNFKFEISDRMWHALTQGRAWSKFTTPFADSGRAPRFRL